MLNTVANLRGNNQEGIIVSGVSRCLIGGTNSPSTVTSEQNGRDGFGIFRSSVLQIEEGSLITQNNSRNGLSILGSSHLQISEGTSPATLNNTKFGLLISEGSSAEILGELQVKDNADIGMIVEISSGVLMNGKVVILDNHNVGLAIGRSSSIQTSESNILYVGGTTGGDGSGISIGENSTLRSPGKVIVENNHDGLYPYGILVVRNSNVTFKGSNVDVTIQNNGSTGIEISQESNGTFEPGVNVIGNKNHGIAVIMNSQLFGQKMIVQNNELWGMHAGDGSSLTCDNCTVDNSNIAGGVELTFGSRSTFNGGSIGSISCDGTVLSRGTYTCP